MKPTVIRNKIWGMWKMIIIDNKVEKEMEMEMEMDLTKIPPAVGDLRATT